MNKGQGSVIKFWKMMLVPPMVEVEIRRRILAILTAIAIVGILLVLVSEVLRDPHSISIPPFLLFLAVAISCAFLTWKRQLGLPSMLLSIGLMLLIATIAYAQNGIHDISVVFFPVLMVFASVLLNRWGSVLVASFASVLLILLVILESNGIIVNEFSAKTDIFDIVPLLVAIWATQSFQWTLMGNFWRNLLSARDAETSAREMSQELERRVTERTQQLEQANRDLAQSNDQLELANRELEAFSYSVSHDLRAPLRAINGFSMALGEDFGGELPAEAKGYLNTIRRNTLRMSDLIDGMLNFSRTSRQVLERREVHMGDVVRQVLAQLMEEQPGTQIAVVVGDLPTCQGDPILLRQVWYNLLSNAFKFTRHQEQARVEVGVENESGSRVYFVRDNGEGFEMQYAGRLFGVFQRLHREDEFEGTGVGLAIAHRILQRHGGRIWVEAKPKEGATFFFTL